LDGGGGLDELFGYCAVSACFFLWLFYLGGVTDVHVRRLFFPPVVEGEGATNGNGKETEEKSEEETIDKDKEAEDKTDETNTNGAKEEDSGDESWEEVEKSELELEAEAEEVAQKLPDPPTSDPAEVEEEKKKGE
jgi:hypothetical protein